MDFNGCSQEWAPSADFEAFEEQSKTPFLQLPLKAEDESNSHIIHSKHPPNDRYDRSAAAFLSENKTLAGFTNQGAGFRQTFVELLENAIDAGGRNVTIKIQPHDLTKRIAKLSSSYPSSTKDVIWSLTVQDNGAGMAAADVTSLLCSIFATSKAQRRIITYESAVHFADALTTKQKGRFGVGVKALILHAQEELYAFAVRNEHIMKSADPELLAAFGQEFETPLAVTTSHTSSSDLYSCRLGLDSHAGRAVVACEQSFPGWDTSATGSVISIPVIGGFENALPFIVAYLERIRLNTLLEVQLWADHGGYVDGLLGLMCSSTEPVVSITPPELTVFDRFPAEMESALPSALPSRCLSALLQLPEGHIMEASNKKWLPQLGGFMECAVRVLIFPQRFQPTNFEYLEDEYADLSISDEAAVEPFLGDNVRETWTEGDTEQYSASTMDALGYVLRFVNGYPLVGEESQCALMRIIHDEFPWYNFGICPHALMTCPRDKAAAKEAVLKRPATSSEWDLSEEDVECGFFLRSSLADMPQLPFSRLAIMVDIRSSQADIIPFSSMTKRSLASRRELTEMVSSTLETAMMEARTRFPSWFASSRARQMAICKEIYVPNIADHIQKIMRLAAMGSQARTHFLSCLPDVHDVPAAVITNLHAMVDIAWTTCAELDGMVPQGGHKKCEFSVCDAETEELPHQDGALADDWVNDCLEYD